MLPPPHPPYGNRLYVTDTDLGLAEGVQLVRLHADHDDPGRRARRRGLGISPDLSFLYVSNELQGTIQRINANPVVAAVPHDHEHDHGRERAAGGLGAAGQRGRDRLQLRRELDLDRPRRAPRRSARRCTTGLGPSDVFVTRRMLGMGLTNEYLAFIPNVFSNTREHLRVVGRRVVLENLPQGRMIATQTRLPRPGARHRGTGPLTIGSGRRSQRPRLLHREHARLERRPPLLQSFTLSPPPGFPGPAGTRTFAARPGRVGLRDPERREHRQHVGPLQHQRRRHHQQQGFAATRRVGGGVAERAASCRTRASGSAWPTTTTARRSSAEVTVPGCDFLQAYYDQ